MKNYMHYICDPVVSDYVGVFSSFSYLCMTCHIFHSKIRMASHHVLHGHFFYVGQDLIEN